jgi:hypothetical protein
MSAYLPEYKPGGQGEQESPVEPPSLSLYLPAYNRAFKRLN